ncbi:MAG: hypothetical protein AB7O62_23665 [Pirellulales bacterium]
MADHVPTPDSGKPKSDDQIRAALQAIRREPHEASPAGPQTNGMGPDERFAVASFYEADNARLFQARLLSLGVLSRSESSRGETRILIDLADREKTLTSLAEHLRESPNLRLPRNNRGLDFALLGGAIGLVIGLVLFSTPALIVKKIAILFIVTAIGGLTGLEIGLLHENLRRHRRFQFGMREFLVLAIIPALMLLFWRIVREELR